MEQLSDDYLVSKTSLHKDIEFINRALEQENILLNVTHKGIYVDGNENQIQRAIKHFLSLYIHKQDDYYLNQLMKSFIGDDSFEQITKLLFERFESVVVQSSEHYLSSLLISITIQLKRLCLGYSIPEESDFLFNHIRYMQSYLIASELAKTLELTFNVTFSTNDIKYLSKLFFAHRIIDENVIVDDSFYEQIIRRITKK